MYPVGSKVVHPCYGAGVVVRVQEKSIGELPHPYYVIRTVSRPMQLMVPVERAQSLGLRSVGEQLGLRGLLETCCNLPDGAIEPDLRTRQATMREQLKSGHFSEVANVVRTLYFMNNRRPLGTVDRQLFDQGKEFLAGELALATDTQIEQAMQEVEDYLAVMFTDA